MRGTLLLLEASNGICLGQGSLSDQPDNAIHGQSLADHDCKMVWHWHISVLSNIALDAQDPLGKL